MTSTLISAASKIMLGTTEATKMYIGDTLMWLAQTTPVNRLPQGYTELLYISSTQSGGLYIDLNIKIYEVANTTFDIAIKFKLTGTGLDSHKQATVFSCLKDINPYPGTFIRRSNNSVVGRYVGANVKDNTIGQVGNIIELPELTSPNKNVYTSVGTNTHTWGTSLFCYFADGSNNPARFAEADIYYFKLFVNGSLVRDMVPCKDSNDVVGMYDVVNNTFYTSPNGAVFVAGPEV